MALDDQVAPGLPDRDLAWHYGRLVGHERAHAAALEWLGSPDPAVRVIAFDVLGGGGTGHPPARRSLIQHAAAATDDPDVRVRVAVAYALLAQVDDPRSVPLLLGLLDDPDPVVRGVVSDGLPGALHGASVAAPAVVALVGLLADPAPKVRNAAAYALGVRLWFDSFAIRAALHRLVDEPDSALTDPAATAALGLARRADPDVYAAIAARLGRPHPGVRWLRAAAALGDRRLLPVLLHLRLVAPVDRGQGSPTGGARTRVRALDHHLPGASTAGGRRHLRFAAGDTMLREPAADSGRPQGEPRERAEPRERGEPGELWEDEHRRRRVTGVWHRYLDDAIRSCAR